MAVWSPDSCRFSLHVSRRLESLEKPSRFDPVDTIILPEPTEVYPERSFESAIVDVVRNLLTATSQSVIVPRLGLDIAIFMAAAGGSRTALIEVKSFNMGNGRVVLASGTIAAKGRRIRAAHPRESSAQGQAWSE
jgi:hypothetical protein